ncbi:MAG: DUF362 domain-containing protein [Rickettsiales bacterium]|jgi:uncharacterized Fe-S center protein|nr:DUF362 domain-containing protein [Rickettsiales bacterium]
MEKSKVYFTDMSTHGTTSLIEKLKRLIKTAGIENIDFENKFAAIKIHFGEPGNLAFLRPNFAKAVVDTVKAAGGKPFLTDCNTLYVGRRKNAIDHLESAAENGFSPASTGCPIIIADGLKGTDETLVPLENTDYVKEAKIGRAIMDADIIISLNHVKGHGMTGFGGALKNLGMGCGSRAGKMEQHCEGKPSVDESKCKKCKACGLNCAQKAITYPDAGFAKIDHDKCVGCGRCIGICNFNAISAKSDSTSEKLCKKIAEYSKAVVQNRPNFHISIVMQVSPHCDCHNENDIAIVGDVGMFASFDPVALDKACVDAINKQPAIAGSLLDKNLKAGQNNGDHFSNANPGTNWKAVVEHGEKIGLGKQDYELITV